jgi:hypothetical protein
MEANMRMSNKGLETVEVGDERLGKRFTALHVMGKQTSKETQRIELTS